MTETEDLRKLVGRLMRRVENLEWEREEEREREGKRQRGKLWSDSRITLMDLVEVKVEEEEEDF